MAKFNWKNGTLVTPARVNIGGNIYDVTPEQYSGQTPLSAENLNAMQDALIDLLYPVGSYYETSDTSFNPNTAWGGTWVEDTEGLSTIAYKASDDDFSTVGATVGEKEHQLTQAELPNVTGQLNFHGSGNLGTVLQEASGVFSGVQLIGQYDQVHTIQGANSFGYAQLNFGENQPHNNIPPSIIVKRWHRTA